MSAKKTFMQEEAINHFLSSVPKQEEIETPAQPETPPVNQAAPGVQSESEPIGIKTIRIPAGMKVNHAVVERRSTKIQILVQPSIAQKFKAKAKAQGRSVNDYIHFLMEQAVEDVQ